MKKKEYPLCAYTKWANETHQRWLDVGNTFGIHLMLNVRDESVAHLVKQGMNEADAMKAVHTTLFAMMNLLDGVSLNKIDANHRVEYVLQSRITSKTQAEPLETFELAPDGDGLAMGLAGWIDGNFGQNNKRRP